MMRGDVVGRTLVLVAAGMSALAVAVPAAARSDVRRAHLAWVTLQRMYFDSPSGVYRGAIGSPARAHAWPFSQALAATLAVARLPRSTTVRQILPSRLAALDRRFRRNGVYQSRPGGDVYYDDNEWIALDLLNWNRVHPGQVAVRKAMRIFRAVADAWSDDPTKKCTGGARWTAAAGNQDRNTVSTANGAILGLRLYALTHRPFLLAWARRMLGWVDQCLLAPDGLYWDHIGGNGRVDTTEWSYNQGSVMEAYRLLYLSTGDGTYLTRARTIADATLATFGQRWSSEPPVFAAIFFRRLLNLARLVPHAGYVTAAQRYADELWAARRTGLLSEAALAQVYAALALRSDPQNP
jgi:predicted alpha-1,6-mannanase (GH76 family)